jgi:uncharacterized protein
MADFELTKKEEKEILLKGLLNTPFITIIGSIFTTFIIAAVFLKFGGPVPVSITQTTVDGANSFEVSEEGSVQVVPDQASLSLGITSLASTVVKAQENVNIVINNLKTQLKQLNIDDKNIKTTSYSIYPNYNYDGPRSNISGYNATVNLEVKIKDFKKLNQVLDIAPTAGINTIGQVTLEVSDEAREKLEDQARNLAVEKAKKKAEKIAKASGLKLGKLINVTENLNDGPIILPFEAAALREGDSETSISPGTTNIVVRVTLSFETL